MLQVKRNQLVTQLTGILCFYLAEVILEFIPGDILHRRVIKTHCIGPVATVCKHIRIVFIVGVVVFDLGEGVKVAINHEFIKNRVLFGQRFKIGVCGQIIGDCFENAFLRPFNIFCVIQVVPGNHFGKAVGCGQCTGNIVPVIPGNQLDAEIHIEFLARLGNQRVLQHLF